MSINACNSVFNCNVSLRDIIIMLIHRIYPFKHLLISTFFTFKFIYYVDESPLSQLGSLLHKPQSKKHRILCAISHTINLAMV
jgi:hypothetical protein